MPRRLATARRVRTLHIGMDVILLANLSQAVSIFIRFKLEISTRPEKCSSDGKLSIFAPGDRYSSKIAPKT